MRLHVFWEGLSPFVTSRRVYFHLNFFLLLVTFTFAFNLDLEIWPRDIFVANGQKCSKITSMDVP